MIRAKFFARTALGLALAIGVSAGAAAPAMAKDKEAKPQEVKFAPSKAFIPLYQASKTALDNASKRPDVVAARQNVTNATAAVNNAQGKKARTDAQTNLDAAIVALGGLLTAERAVVDSAVAGATSPDDKFLAGQLMLNLGNIAADKKVQRAGVQMQLDSGKLPAADRPKYLNVLGTLAMDLKDYPGARAALQGALDAGYTGTDTLAMLADAFIKDNQPAAGLKVLQDAINRTGAAAPEGWMRYGIASAYKAKLPTEAAAFANQLVAMYPSTENWTLSIAVLRDLYRFQGQDQIDLLRLMERTKSFSEERDYVEYVQAADPRRLPGEALKIINEGLAAGKLRATDQFVIDSKAQSSGRIAADKASLAGLERDARAANSTAATAQAAGDAYLSYDDTAKAEEMYRIALTKAGVDTTRVQLRLGIAQTDQGKYAEAQDNFAKVTDSRAPIARLWAAYAKNKAAGK